MIDPKAKAVELSVSGRDFTLIQSPGALQSGRKEGTTGAAVWQSSVRAAEWLAAPDNVLFHSGLLHGGSTVLELGSGVSVLVPFFLAKRVKEVVATDQQHVLKLLEENIHDNALTKPPKKGKQNDTTGNIQALALDWEEDDIPKHLASNGLGDGVDFVFACDTLYNYGLIDPFVEACVDVCHLRQQKRHKGDEAGGPTACVIVQQLRQAEVFEQWLETSIRRFRVWRVPDNMLTAGLKEGSGFAVHILLLREEV